MARKAVALSHSEQERGLPARPRYLPSSAVVTVVLAMIAVLVQPAVARAVPSLRATGLDYVTPGTSARVTAPAVDSTTSPRLRFTFDSPSHPWSTDDLAKLQSWTATGSAVMKAISQVVGAPAHDLTVNVSQNPDLTVAGVFYPGNPQAEMQLRKLGLSVVVHELNHAIHDEWIISNAVWEEGMARGAEDEELHLLAQQGLTDPSGDPEHAYSYDVYYDALNVPDVAVQSDAIWGYGEAALSLLRYEQAGYAFGKLIIEDPPFVSDFNARLFQHRSGALPASVLVGMAAFVQPTIEGTAFGTWYANQHIFDPTPPSGCRMFQRINQWTVDFFCRDAQGLETPQSGATVTCSISAADSRVLYTSQTITTGLGWTSCEPPATALEGYDGRLSIVAAGTSATGSATSSYYRQSGGEAGVFGVITNANSGTIAFSSPAHRFRSFTVKVINGAFAAPTLTGVRGTIQVRFQRPGLKAGRIVTKAAAPYALVLTANRR